MFDEVNWSSLQRLKRKEFYEIRGQSHRTILVKFYLPFFESFIFSQDRKIMNALIKWSSLQKSAIKFTPKKFDEINPCSWVCIHNNQFSV